MNYIKHLTGFFEKVAIDKKLNPTHISLYIALFQFWNCNRFKNPISINRDEVMRISKISSKATYHKCLKNLHNLGYINYEPSYNPFKGSHVILFNFSDDLKPAPKSERKPKNEPLNELVSEQALNKSCTSSETGTEQAVIPSINYINNTNILNDKNVSNLEKQTKKNFEKINNSDLKNENSEKEKNSAKKEKEEMQNENSAFANSDENQIKTIGKKVPIKKKKSYSHQTKKSKLISKKITSPNSKPKNSSIISPVSVG
ncbi:transcriptional regulator [Flavobacterium piscinae]|uniref:transcriptional regulator n=1 Tax=Flavobacterium piscinae TaxID=2506424 RepID=UPI002AAB099A|nr:transcriptional regulator [Flavobacterium piscinae]